MITLVNGIDADLPGQGNSRLREASLANLADGCAAPSQTWGLDAFQIARAEGRKFGYDPGNDEMNTTADLCTVCAEPVEPHTNSLCGMCGATFHLNQRTDLPGKDCGDVWINSEHLGLEFTCSNCLAGLQQAVAPASVLDNILDLPEAAEVLGIPERDLSERARRGEIQHRKTAGGLLLFERGIITVAQERTAP